MNKKIFIILLPVIAVSVFLGAIKGATSTKCIEHSLLVIKMKGVGKTGNTKKTLLFEAVKNNDFNELKALAATTKFSVKEIYKALAYAGKNGSDEVFAFLVELAQKTNLPVSIGFSKSDRKKDENIELLASLLEYLNNPDPSTKESNSVFVCVGKNGNKKVLGYLVNFLENKGNYSVIYEGMIKAFKMALKNKQFDFCNFLTSHSQLMVTHYTVFDSSVNKSLRVAAENGDLEIIKYLVSNEKSLKLLAFRSLNNVFNYGVNTALVGAMENGHEDVFNFLITNERTKKLITVGDKDCGVYGLLRLAKEEDDEEFIDYLATNVVIKPLIKDLFFLHLNQLDEDDEDMINFLQFHGKLKRCLK